MSNKLYAVPDTFDWSYFRKNLKSLMDSNGYNMSMLAERCDLNVTSISRYLQGRIPDLIAAWRIADHFGVSIDWLIGRNEDKFDNYSEEQHSLINKYNLASPEDKNVVKLFLSKYE